MFQRAVVVAVCAAPIKALVSAGAVPPRSCAAMDLVVDWRMAMTDLRSELLYGES